MTAIGETLRRERLRRNLELDAVSHELKISQKFLEAIEDERFDELPGGVFAKSFVRQYARMLGLDEEELAGEVQRAVEPPSVNSRAADQSRHSAPVEIHVPRVEEWENVSGGRFPRSSPLPALALVVVMMLVCSGVYAWWQRSTRHVAPSREGAAAAQATAPAQQPQAPSPEAAVQPPAALPEASLSAQVQAPAQSTPDPATPAVTPASTALPAESIRPAGVPAATPGGGQVLVAMTADEPVWVLARTDGKFSFSGTLEPNKTRTVEGNESVLLRLGNAGGVSFTLNGKPVGMVGPKGQVRTVQFTSGGFQIVAAPKPSLPLDDIL